MTDDPMIRPFHIRLFIHTQVTVQKKCSKTQEGARTSERGERTGTHKRAQERPQRTHTRPETQTERQGYCTVSRISESRRSKNLNSLNSLNQPWKKTDAGWDAAPLIL